MDASLYKGNGVSSVVARKNERRKLLAAALKTKNDTRKLVLRDGRGWSSSLQNNVSSETGF